MTKYFSLHSGGAWLIHQLGQKIKNYSICSTVVTPFFHRSVTVTLHRSVCFGKVKSHGKRKITQGMLASLDIIEVQLSNHTKSWKKPWRLEWTTILIVW